MASLHSGGLSGSERAYQQDVLCLDRAPSCLRGYLWEPCVLRLPPSSTAQSIPIVIRLLLKRNILWLIDQKDKVRRTILVSKMRKEQ